MSVLRSPYPDVPVPDVSLSEYVLGGAVARGDKPALIDGASGAITTYAEFADQVARTASGLAAEGIGGGDAAQPVAHAGRGRQAAPDGAREGGNRVRAVAPLDRRRRDRQGLRRRRV